MHTGETTAGLWKSYSVIIIPCSEFVDLDDIFIVYHEQAFFAFLFIVYHEQAAHRLDIYHLDNKNIEVGSSHEKEKNAPLKL